MSKVAKIFATSTFCYPLFSYVWRVLFVPEQTRSRVEKAVRQFVLAVPTVKLLALSHVQRMFGIRAELHDFRLRNVVGLIGAAVKLETFDAGQIPLSGDIGHAGHPMRMWRHYRRAFCFFRNATGTTAHAVTTPSGAGTGAAARALYRRLIAAEADAVEGHVRRRLRDRGIRPQCALDNLARLPSTIPQRHRWALFQWLLNAPPTARRMRFRGDVGANTCLLCGGGEDSIEHMCTCPVVHAAYEAICSSTGVMDEWRDSYAFLSLQLHGAQLQSIAALLFAVGRARWAMRRGRRFDLVQRLLRLVEHPWLSAGDGLVSSSFGAVRLRDGAVQGRVGSVFPACSNSAAEYGGMLSCFRDALQRPDAAVTFQVDSLLLARQCNMEWRCRSPSLIPHWEQEADLLRRLRDRGTACTIRHIYRECNALADSIANE
ncbi:unnamed protein product, partial [Prorocentrum cordatum]